MDEVYITAAGFYLPNKPVSNDDMENILGKIHGKLIGGEHISSGGLLIGLEAGAMEAQYFDDSGDNQNTFYPMIHFKHGKVF